MVLVWEKGWGLFWVWLAWIELPVFLFQSKWNDRETKAVIYEGVASSK